MSNVILCDFDGTLVNDSGKLDKEGVRLLNLILAEGNKMCIVSSSSYSLLINFIDTYKLDVDVYSLSSSMALIKGEPVIKTIPKALINKLLYKFHDDIYTGYTESLTNTLIYNYQDRLDLIYPKNNRKIVETIDEDISSFTFAIANEKVSVFMEELNLLRIDYRVLAADKNRHLIQIHRNTISKLDAYYLIKTAYPDIKIIGISDSYYDIDMLSKCDIKIAMKNADNELREIADIITEEDNNSSGALKTLYNICHFQ